MQDSSGARIANAKIEVSAIGSAIAREATTEDRGEFLLDDLLPGNYQVKAVAKGFVEAHTEVIIAVSTVRDVTVTLKPLAVPQTVNVESQASSITTESIDLASAVHQSVVTGHDSKPFHWPLEASRTSLISHPALSR